ncbi:hypothetical protein [Leptospira yasudae]|uniref:hypothetical protein n=1 Tax=Leptospira yasudae TaxID=2202201 RepID=UPI001FF039BB|nr:hypothetical protein [Leptospira yasudae]
MKLDTVSLLKSTARTSFTILVNTIFFSLIGWTLNWILLAFLFPEMKALASGLGGIPAARAGGIGAILALIIIVIELWPVTLMVLTFGIAFPFLHFLFGKKFAVSKALQMLITDHLEPVSIYLSEKLEASIRKKAEADKSAGKKFSVSEQIQNLPYYLGKLEDLPSPIRFLVKRMTDKFGIETLLKEISGRIPDSENPNAEDLQKALKRAIEFAIQETFLPPNLNWFFILGGINLGIFLILKILF